MEYDFWGGRSGSGPYGAPPGAAPGGGSSLYPRVGQPSHGGGGASTASPRAAPYHHGSGSGSSAPVVTPLAPPTSSSIVATVRCSQQDTTGQDLFIGIDC